MSSNKKLNDLLEGSNGIQSEAEEAVHQADQSLINKKLLIDIDRLKEEIYDLKQNRSERKIYARLAFKLICSYLAAVFLLLLAVGGGKIYLSDAVLLSIVATLAPNVLGIFYFVMKYLFNK